MLVQACGIHTQGAGGLTGWEELCQDSFFFEMVNF